MRRVIFVVSLFVAVLTVAVGVAMAGSETFSGANYYSPGTRFESYLHHLIGDSVDNGSCEGNGVDCGTYVCARAFDPNYNSYGHRYCANDSIYHPGFNQNYLRAAFDEYSYAGAYIYGTAFY